MWSLDNRTPFAAERAWVRDRDGAEIWLVAVKATFQIDESGSLTVAREQPPVTLIPVHVGKPSSSSLRLDSDLPRTKLTTDILVTGHVHAPDGKAVTELNATVSVGQVSKSLKVYGNRVWQARGIGRPQPFVRMPIVYERAFGGVDPAADKPAWDARNPVGQGFITAAKHAPGRRLPNLEDPDALVRSWSDRPEPAGFGPLCCHWQARAQWAGTYGDDWRQRRMPLLPEDFDDRHYQCAHRSLQSPQFLRGGEPVLLHNLCQGRSELRFNLPRVHLGFDTFFFAGDGVRHEPPRLHTVLIEPDALRVSLVWHTALPCHPRVLKLKNTRIRLKQDLRESVLAGAAAAVRA